MAQYRKKPVVIEAAHWTGWVEGMTPAVAELLGDTWADVAVEDYGRVLVIPTLEGDMRAQVGDWIIKGVQGEFYPCKPAIFDATYEPVKPVPNDGHIHSWDKDGKCEHDGEYHA